MQGSYAASSLIGSIVLSALAVLVLARFAPRLGIIDVPGGRKLHAAPVPLVGGLAAFITLLAMSWVVGIAKPAAYFHLALAVVIAIGFWDDVREIPPRLKFAIQVIASGIMIWGAGIQLNGVGDLFGWRPIGLSIFAVPMSVFAVVGVVNSINMMDGLDGLAGSLSLVAFTWFAFVAAQSNLPVQYYTALIMAGAIAGFLLFNLRFPWQKQARVFLGDAGSLMIGFALGWFAIDLTQGAGRTFPPIAALWIVMLPLVDCVSLMTRRLAAGKSPFVADRGHIHHYLLARGFTPTQTVAMLVGASVMFGAVGYFGWLYRVPEPFLFYPFFIGFFAYHLVMKREWDRIARRDAGIASDLPIEAGEPARQAE